MDRDFFKNLKVANYNRKSSESEDRQVLSIGSQIEEAKKLGDYLGICDMISYEDSKSAKNPGERTGYLNMLEDIKSGKRDAILCWKLNRLTRNMIDGGELMHLLQRGILKAIFTPGRTYLPTDNVITIAVEFGDANQFLLNLTSDVKRGQNKKAQMGIPHGLAKIGFINDKTEEKGNRKWLADKIRLPIIKEILELYLTGNYSGGQMYDWAIKVGLTTPRHKKSGGNPITHSRIYTILRDPIYAGFFYHGSQRYELDKSLPRLITEDQHNKILRMLTGRNLPKTQSHQSTYGGFIKSPQGEFIGSDFKYQVICECKHKFSYTNKTHCPKCGKEIISIKNPKYLEYEFYYNVSMKKRRLSVKYVPQKQVTNFLVEFADKFTLSPALAKWSRKYIHELHDSEVEKNLVVAEGQKQRFNQLEIKKEKYRNLLAEGMIAREEYEHDIRKINSEMEKLRESSEKSINWIEQAENIIDLGVEMKKILENGTTTSKREVLSRLGSNLIWNEEELFICNTKSIQVLIDGLNEARQKNNKFEPKNSLADKDKTEVFASVHPIMLPLLDMFRTLNWKQIEMDFNLNKSYFGVLCSG